MHTAKILGNPGEFCVARILPTTYRGYEITLLGFRGCLKPYTTKVAVDLNDSYTKYRNNDNQSCMVPTFKNSRKYRTIRPPLSILSSIGWEQAPHMTQVTLKINIDPRFERGTLWKVCALNVS